jgi:hypothetical protein
MKVQTCKIIITKSTGKRIILNRCISITINSSWKNLTDTAKVELQLKWKLPDNTIANIFDLIESDDAIEIQCGYNGEHERRFKGYVRSVSPKLPVTLECEDEMYKLKSRSANFIYSAVRLPEMLKKMLPDIPIDALDVEMGGFKAKATTVAKVLLKIKEMYGLVAYFQDGTLHVGRVYSRENLPTHDINLYYDALNDNLTFLTDKERKVKIKAISNRPGKDNIEVEVGEEDGDEITQNFYNIGSEAELKKLANAAIAKFKVTGYQGDFSTYAVKNIRHSEKVAITHTLYRERNGVYYAEGTEEKFDSSGWSVKVNLGQKAI